jgi:hypothetical protein
MDRPATASPANARDIILEIVRNMREGLEPLRYSTLPPSVYHVYLHPDDLDRLRGIVPRIVDEARQALDAELQSLNRASIAERLKISNRDGAKIVAPEGGWQIKILENTDDDSEAGDIAIHSELALPAKAELGSGSMTKRIATRRNTAARATYAETAAKPAEAPAENPAPAESGPYLATIEYEERGERKSFQITKEQIVVGRGGRDYWTDLKLEAVPDVSREHFRLRRDPANGQFFLKDLSRLGTTINGQKVPSSIEFTEGEKRDRNVEVPVPAQARIGLADVVFLEFRSSAHG